jgi:site-specific recombinase XerD
MARPPARQARHADPTTISGPARAAAHVLRTDHRVGLRRRPGDGSRSSPATSPNRDEPLPKFLDDPTAAKFMAALAVDPTRRRRLMVELLARTGMRVPVNSSASTDRRNGPHR